MPSSDELAAMPRKQLQQLAKAAGIRANLKTVELVARLAEHHKAEEAEHHKAEEMDLPEMPATPENAAAPAALSRSPLTPGMSMDLGSVKGSLFEKPADEEEEEEVEVEVAAAKPDAPEEAEQQQENQAEQRRHVDAASMEAAAPGTPGHGARDEVMKMLEERVAQRKTKTPAKTPRTARGAAAGAAKTPGSARSRRSKSVSARFDRAHDKNWNKGTSIEAFHERQQRAAARRERRKSVASPAPAGAKRRRSLSAAAGAAAGEDKPAKKKAATPKRKRTASVGAAKFAKAAQATKASVPEPVKGRATERVKRRRRDSGGVKGALAAAASAAVAVASAAVCSRAKRPSHRRGRSRIPAMPNSTRATATTPHRRRAASRPPAADAAAAGDETKPKRKASFNLQASLARGALPWKAKPAASRLHEPTKRLAMQRVTNAARRAAFKATPTRGRDKARQESLAKSASRRHAKMAARRAALQAEKKPLQL